MKLDHSTRNKWNQNTFEAVLMPEATVGHCRNHRKCGQFSVDLANGYCTLCWDRGLNTREAREEEMALKKVKAPAPYTDDVKKSRRHSITVGGSTYMVG